MVGSLRLTHPTDGSIVPDWTEMLFLEPPTPIRRLCLADEIIAMPHPPVNIEVWRFFLHSVGQADHLSSRKYIFNHLDIGKKMKFYNGATIWGKLDKFSRETTATGKAYIEIFVHCQHVQYGNVRILGRIWGQDAVDEFNDNV